jgi:hypothetical protein
MRNRTGANGAIFENAAFDLVDFGFIPSTGSGNQSNFRLEHRAAKILNASNTTGEFQFINSGSGATLGWFASGPSATIINTGSLGVGISTPGYKLDVNGDANIAAASALRFGGTSVCTSAGCTSSSDRNLKENIQPLQGSLEKILTLQGVEYDYKDKKRFTDQHQVGVIAQDVEKVFPEVVRTDDKTGLKSVAYDHLVAPLIEAVKALYSRVVGIEERQAIQNREIASVKAQAEVEKKVKDQEIAELKARVQKAERENAAIKAYLCKKDPKAAICS